MQLTIQPFTYADAAAVGGAHEVHAAVNRVDVPDYPPTTMDTFLGMMRYPWPGQLELYWLALMDGQPAGWLNVGLPQLDNTHVVGVDLMVHPDFRRQGVGRALYEKVVEVAREHGRNVLQGMYVCQTPGGSPRDPRHAAFADAMGAKPALPEVRRRLDLDTIDQATWAPMLEQARERATGYSTLTWTDSTPDEIVVDLAALDSRFLAEAPLGDLNLEPEKVDVSRVRAGEEIARNRGRRTYHVAARHDATGQLAAWTTISFNPGVDTHAWQQITIVDRAHRGRRLGLLVKLENLAQTLTQEPALRHINTWNANENTHMIAINEQIGFRVVDQWMECQQEL